MLIDKWDLRTTGDRQAHSDMVADAPRRVLAALEACRQAHFSDALDLLRDDRTPESSSAAFLLYVRLLLRTSPTDVIPIVARHYEALTVPEHRQEAGLLLASAQARVRDFKSASAGLQRVREAVTGTPGGSGRLYDELQYREALALWMQRKLAPAEAALASLLDKPDAAFYFEALILDGAISAARERYEQQAATLLKALRVVVTAEARDVLHWAHVTTQLSILMREMPSPSLRTAVLENVDDVPWTPDIADLHFTALKAIGWRHALDGDYFSAFRYLKRAGRVATTEAWQVVSMCDRATLAQSLGERRFTEQELDDVSEVADGIEWCAVLGEERLALLLLAVLHAPTDGALALSYIARFQETGTRFDGLLSANEDRRLKATVDYSLGYVYARLNYRDEALIFLKDAWTTFNVIGYDWRAASCAKEIAALTRDGAWLALGREKIAAYPRSWIAAEINAASEHFRNDNAPSANAPSSGAGRDALLTPAQREVYRLLMDGIAVSEIARASNRSEFTIRNHIKAIFKTFHVNSRSALMRARSDRL